MTQRAWLAVYASIPHDIDPGGQTQVLRREMRDVAC